MLSLTACQLDQARGLYSFMQAIICWSDRRRNGYENKGTDSECHWQQSSLKTLVVNILAATNDNLPY